MIPRKRGEEGVGEGGISIATTIASTTREHFSTGIAVATLFDTISYKFYADSLHGSLYKSTTFALAHAFLAWECPQLQLIFRAPTSDF